jgi:hypothetical protein
VGRESIPFDWQFKTIQHLLKFPDNKYFFQTKNLLNLIAMTPKPYGKTHYCVTIETNRFYDNIMGFSLLPQERAYYLSKLKENRYVTIEPIMQFDLKPMVELIKKCEPKQVNIGANSLQKMFPVPEPTGEEIKELIYELEKFTIVHKKKNLNRLLNN